MKKLTRREGVFLVVSFLGMGITALMGITENWLLLPLVIACLVAALMIMRVPTIPIAIMVTGLLMLCSMGYIRELVPGTDAFLYWGINGMIVMFLGAVSMGRFGAGDFSDAPEPEEAQTDN